MTPRPTRDDLARYRDATIDDLLPLPGRPLHLLFVGINPSLWSAAVNAHFARPGNRFWTALHAGGLVDRRIDPSSGMAQDDLDHVRDQGIGITNLVTRATARADELDVAEFRAGRKRLEDLVEKRRPRAVAVAGITAYRAAFERRRAPAGLQPEGIAGSTLLVVPNPSGLNAHATPAVLAAAYRAAGQAAGISMFAAPGSSGSS